MAKKHIKFGAVGFNAQASPTEINRFINNLPASKRQSLYQVSEELESAGMIETTGEITHNHNKNLYTDE